MIRLGIVRLLLTFFLSALHGFEARVAFTYDKHPAMAAHDFAIFMAFLG